MPETEQNHNQHRIVDLNAGAHVMFLERGVFCVFHAPGQTPPDESGLPGVCISRAPGVPPGKVDICTFEADGWMGGVDSAALVRVHEGPVGVMITTYRAPDSDEGPRLQVMRLTAEPAPQAAPEMVASVQTSDDDSLVSTESGGVSGAEAALRHEVQAHIQRQGDCSAAVGEWIGTPGSELWIEGFAINPPPGMAAEDIEYQAVLGKGWLSPWVEGGHFCGSRGMSLPVLGLRVRLKGKAAGEWHLHLSASFTDGTQLGPRETMEDALEAESLAPLEAFLLELAPRQASKTSGTDRKKKVVTVKTAQGRQQTSRSTSKSDRRRR